MREIESYLRNMVETRASDLHLKVGCPPMLRILGDLLELDGSLPLTDTNVMRLLREVLNEDQQKAFQNKADLDFSVTVDEERFRCNCYHENLGPAVVFRRIANSIPTLQELRLPPKLDSFAHLRSGLVLVTGATGSGKSTTVASILQVVNTEYHKHIITLEDPIEYTYESANSLIQQRGLNTDFLSFSDGITAALRQDPDVLLIGEMRDTESIRLALSAAETGVLVYSTLHSNGAAESVNRIVDVFPSGDHSYIRSMLSQTLQAVVSQVLISTEDGNSRVPATEVLVNTPAVSSLIRNGKTREMHNIIQAGANDGMHTLDDSLQSLMRNGHINLDQARHYASNKRRFSGIPALMS